MLQENCANKPLAVPKVYFFSISNSSSVCHTHIELNNEFRYGMDLIFNYVSLKDFIFSVLNSHKTEKQVIGNCKRIVVEPGCQPIHFDCVKMSVNYNFSFWPLSYDFGCALINWWTFKRWISYRVRQSSPR